MTEREAIIILNMISGIGYAKYKVLTSEFGSAAAIFSATAGELLAVRGIGEQLSGRILNYAQDVPWQRELEMAERGGVRLLTLQDEAYPGVLRELHDPPLVLYVRGSLPEFGVGRALGVVGSRRMSHYGQEMTALLTADAVDAGFAIISGLALGVDTVAHQTTVDKNGITVAVLGGGLARLHPQENLPLARRIIECGGAIISEFPMTFPVSRTSFPRRNRIVAGLSDGVLVTEAGLDSGALITANLALEMSGCVMAVPGRVDNPQARGCNKLIKSGQAGLVENIDDILQLLSGDLFSRPGVIADGDLESVPEYKASGFSDLTPEAVRIIDALREAPEQSFDDLSFKLEMAPGALTTQLMLLEMKLLIRCSGQRYSLR